MRVHQHYVANHARPGDTPRVVVVLMVAVVCVATIAWWAALFLLLRWLIVSVF